VPGQRSCFQEVRRQLLELRLETVVDLKEDPPFLSNPPVGLKALVAGRRVRKCAGSVCLMLAALFVIRCVCRAL
jgi:hypothetical protein